MIAALLLLALPQLQTTPAPPSPPADHGLEPGPRAALAHLGGFETVSKLDFGERQNRLTAVYVFPDRARWHFESYGAKLRSEHQYFYRCGGRVRELVSGKPSRELAEGERDTVIVQMELRRAAMLWPDGFEWARPNGAPENTRSAEVREDSCCRKGVLGTLVATLDGDRPGRIEARDPEGRAIESLEVREWKEHDGRKWPLRLAFEAQGASFVETVETIETRIHYLDLSFVPPDLRPLAPLAPGPTVMARDLVSMTYSVHELPEGLAWDEALARAKTWIAAAGTEQPLAVDPTPTFELTPEGRPRTCLVRLIVPVRPAPPGFESHVERAGLFLGLQDLSALGAPAISRLLEATPQGALPGTPYVRVHPKPNPIELVLPLEPPD